MARAVCGQGQRLQAHGHRPGNAGALRSWPEGARPRVTLILALEAPEPEEKKLSPPVCGHLLQRPQDTDTHRVHKLKWAGRPSVPAGGCPRGPP